MPAKWTFDRPPFVLAHLHRHARAESLFLSQIGQNKTKKNAVLKTLFLFLGNYILMFGRGHLIIFADKL